MKKYKPRDVDRFQRAQRWENEAERERRAALLLDFEKKALLQQIRGAEIANEAEQVVELRKVFEDLAERIAMHEERQRVNYEKARIARGEA